MIKDLRYAFRALARRPAFTAVAVITLALGIGANTAIFSVVYGVLLRPLGYPEAEQLVALRESNPLKQPDAQIAPGNFLEWQKQNTVFSDLAAYRNVSYNLTGDGDPERLLAGRVTAGLFKTLGVQPIAGREFLAQEDQPGREKVVIIGAGLWQRRFGSDPHVIGRTIKLSGEDFTVVGVMPSEFRLPDQRERELWTPIAFSDNERTLHHARYFEAIGRLKRGVTLDQAQAELSVIAGRLAQEHPDTNAGWTVKVTPALAFAVGDNARRTLWMLFEAVGLILLIACANVTNLLLARAATREKEIAIRVALGAGRLRIVRQLAAESLLLAFLGAMAGWPIAAWSLKALLLLAPPDLPRLAAVTIDLRALLFTFVTSLLTALMSGLTPALQLAKTHANQALKEGGSEGDRGVTGRRIGDVLIAGEVAIAVLLLICTGLFLRTLWQLYRVDPGFDDRNALAVTLQLSEKKYSDNQQLAVFSEQLAQQAATLPGVEATGIARILPIVHDLTPDFYLEGQSKEPDNTLRTNYSAVSPGYFKAMGIPVLAGRVFTAQDTQGAARVAIVSAGLARRYFGNENLIGKRINVTTGPEAFREIVGVVGDVKQQGLFDTRPVPQVYEPFAQAPNHFMTLIVRTSGDPSALVPTIRSKVLELDHDLPLQRVTTLDKIVSNSIRGPRFVALLFSLLAGVALVLTLVGIYGVVSYSVAQRTRELGIRMALGAQSTDVLRLVVIKTMTFVLLGEFIGMAVADRLTEPIRTSRFTITNEEIAMFGAIAVSLFLVALVACYVPARRATKMDPLVALK